MQAQHTPHKMISIIKSQRQHNLQILPLLLHTVNIFSNINLNYSVFITPRISENQTAIYKNEHENLYIKDIDKSKDTQQIGMEHNTLTSLSVHYIGQKIRKLEHGEYQQIFSIK